MTRSIKIDAKFEPELLELSGQSVDNLSLTFKAEEYLELAAS